jgi:serine/threonine-protein kinase
MFPVDWSRNGTLLLSRVDAVASLYFLRVGGDRKPVAYLATPFSEYAPKFSPDGKWVAYRSSEAGRSEIYVRPFPDAGAGKWMISNGGGFAPRWLADGREIIYLSQDRVLMSVEVNIAGPKFQSSPPKPLFAVNVANPNAATGVIGRSWDVTPDGRRFLILQASERKGPEPMTVVLNWQAGLKK